MGKTSILPLFVGRKVNNTYDRSFQEIGGFEIIGKLPEVCRSSQRT
jgi:hypothetical protein